MSSAGTPSRGAEGFRHEALLYAGTTDFMTRVVPFVAEAVTNREPVLVVVSARKIDLLRTALDGASGVRFADMDTIGHNPARIMPVWHDFVHEHAEGGRRIRGVGEPVTPDRSDDEIVECHRHEALLNIAFATSTGFWLRCPYDTTTVGTDVVEEARRNHPLVVDAGGCRHSPVARDPATIGAPFDEPLPPPPSHARSVTFDESTLASVRALANELAAEARLGRDRSADWVLAANEVATNSVCHGGGAGVALGWSTGDTIRFETRDAGLLDKPLAGRCRPGPSDLSGRGLWIANQVCDLVQLRSSPRGTVVRLHLRVR